MQRTDDLAAWLDDLAAGLARDGVAAHRGELDELAGRARALGVAPGAVEALADASAPEVVGLRASAVVARAVSRPSPWQAADRRAAKPAMDPAESGEWGESPRRPTPAPARASGRRIGQLTA